MSPRSFADPETHFEVVRSETPVDVDGYKIGEPTGEVRCEVCEATALTPEGIPHPSDCPPRDVSSRWAARF